MTAKTSIPATRRPRVTCRNHVTPEDVQRLLPLAAGAIGPLASAQTVLAVAAHNPDCIWMIQGEAGRSHGFQAWLLLNEAGRKALLDGKMSLSSPELGHISEPGEKPSLLYIWATYAPGKTACGVERIHEHFSSPFYADVDMVSWAAGTRGERALARHGFVKGVQTGNRRIEHLWMLARSPASIRQRLPLYDTYLPGTGPWRDLHGETARHRKGHSDTGSGLYRGAGMSP